MKAPPGNFPQEIVPELISYLKSLQRRGISSLYLGASREERAAAPAAAEEPGPGESVTEKNPTETAAQAFARIEAEVASCVQCGLHEGRTRTVFGSGNPESPLLFIGEGPGREEDRQGLPFVGRSGQLLTKIIEAIEMKREDVYITNIVKCRPPDNRNPQEKEVRCCEQYLIRQIDCIKPRVICALGRVAAHWLLETDAPLSALRNSDHAYHGIPVVVTYHPAALLRNPGLKKAAWDDFKRIRSMVVS